LNDILYKILILIKILSIDTCEFQILTKSTNHVYLFK